MGHKLCAVLLLAAKTTGPIRWITIFGSKSSEMWFFPTRNHIWKRIMLLCLRKKKRFWLTVAQFFSKKTEDTNLHLHITNIEIYLQFFFYSCHFNQQRKQHGSCYYVFKLVFLVTASLTFLCYRFKPRDAFVSLACYKNIAGLLDIFQHWSVKNMGRSHPVLSPQKKRELNITRFTQDWQMNRQRRC